MTLGTYLRGLKANPDNPNAPPLCVARGYLSDDENARVTDSSYIGLPYCYLLTEGDTPVQRYDDGSARWLNPVDLVLEAESEDPDVLWPLINHMAETLPDAVDELDPGVPLHGMYFCQRFLRPERRRPGFVEATLTLENRL